MDSRTKKQRILIVDDQPTNIQTLIEVLKDDYILTTAINGNKAIQLATSDTPPDLILLDVMMPEIDGYEVIATLKSNPISSEIPVIFVTSMGDVTDEAKGFSLGASDYIIKPISPLLLKARVKVHLELQIKRKELEKTVKILERKLALIAPPEEPQEREAAHQEATLEKIDADYFLDDHQNELYELESEIDAVINMLLLKKKVDNDLMKKSGALLGRYAEILSLYPIFWLLGKEMFFFAQNLQQKEFQPDEVNTRLAMGFLESLVFTLRHFFTQIASNAIENPNIYDNSMLSDMKMALSALENDLEDVSGAIEFFY